MRLVLLFILLLALGKGYGQISEPFDSFDGPGLWTSPGGNTGSHSGELCYNVTGTYQTDTWLIFESPIYDFSSYGQVDLLWVQDINLRNGDELRLYLFDNGWSYFDLTNLNGLYQVTIPNTVTRITFDLLTYGNGNVNNKYAHIAFLDILNPTPLPVELLDFSVTPADDGVLIDWSTASEYNSDYFSVFRSIDGTDWTKIAEIPAAGYSTSKIDYEYKDPSIYYHWTYYRLKQTDMDGTMESWYPKSIYRRPTESKFYNLMGQEADKGILIDKNKCLHYKQ
jgi:hypothetical protein